MSVYFPQVVIPTIPPQTTLDVTFTVRGGPPIDSLVAMVDASWNLQVVFTANSRTQKFPANTLQGDYFLTGRKYTEPKAASARLVTLTGEDQSFYLDIDEGQRPQGGNGLLSGSFPLSMLTNDGNLPSQAEIRILYRPNTGDPGDGYVVATTTCNADGTWQVSGLDEDLKFDIVARIPGFNDVLISDVQPTGAPLSAHFAGIKEEYEYQEEVEIQVVALGGIPPYTFTINELPEGLNFNSNTGYITGQMPAGDLKISVSVLDSASTVVNLLWEGLVEMPIPTEIGQEFGGGYYIGNILVGETNYAIVMAGPDGNAQLPWKNSTTNTPNTLSRFDGLANSIAMQADGISSHQAAQHCLNFRGGNYTDWYFPAVEELLLAWNNIALLTALNMESSRYWSSTQASSDAAINIDFRPGTGTERKTLKNQNYFIRPVRRIEIPQE